MSDSGGRAPARHARVPGLIAAVLLAGTAAILVAVALLAGRAGPWVANPPGADLTIRPFPTPSLSPPADINTSTVADSAPDPASATWLITVGFIVAGLLVLLLIIWVARALRRPAAPMAEKPPVNRVAEGIALAPGDVEDRVEDTDARSFDPRVSANAIIATWAGLEVAAAAAGCPRRPASTPTEFLTALDIRFPPPPGEVETDRVLLRLYHRARFDTSALSPGVAVEAAEAAARIRRRFGHAPIGNPS